MFMTDLLLLNHLMTDLVLLYYLQLVLEFVSIVVLCIKWVNANSSTNKKNPSNGLLTVLLVIAHVHLLQPVSLER